MPTHHKTNPKQTNKIQCARSQSPFVVFIYCVLNVCRQPFEPLCRARTIIRYLLKHLGPRRFRKLHLRKHMDAALIGETNFGHEPPTTDGAMAIGQHQQHCLPAKVFSLSRRLGDHYFRFADDRSLLVVIVFVVVVVVVQQKQIGVAD